ncbi:MAG TPA: substrate-binding domain-containing protein [Candidatus Hydrogenedentes bacterium]|nr:substrate-binding domain-containing protein [Candidatus Hydrogenedentota bacterium]
MKAIQVGIVLCLAGVLCGCGAKPGAVPVKPKVIGAALLTQTHVFYQDMVSAMEDEAKKQGFKLRLQYAEFDSQKQINQVETFIAQGVDAIIVAPNDSSGMTPVIAAARAKNIPVFTADIAAHGAQVVSHIASDNEKGGVLLAEYLAKRLNGKGKVAIIDHPTVASVQERTKGFLQTLAKYPDMQIVQKVPGEGQRDKAMRVTQDLLQAHPDLAAIFGINDDSALGALAAVESAGLQDKIVIVGFDGTPEAETEIAAGKALKADAVQYPKKIGQKTIEVIAACLRGEKVPPVVPVEVGLIDQASLKGGKP